MMNKYLTFLTIATIGLSAATPIEAKTISPEEALNRLNKTNRLPAKANYPQNSLKLSKTIYTENANEEAVYIFDDADGKGFVLLSADDALPAVLGYSDRGFANLENPAPGFAWLLEHYAAQVEYARENNIEFTTRADDGDEKAPIEPLLTTKWDQEEPFNINVPTLTTTGKRHCAAGCVAVAMAQVMYHHKYPTVGTGTCTGTWAGGEVYADLSNYPFDWDNMLDDYSSGYYSDAEEKAAADLVYATGMSVSSTYASTTTAKSQYVLTSLCENFGYSKEMRLCYHDYITSEDWENLLYGSLSRNRPVFYDGDKEGVAVGHAFVCDGYQGNGYFHFNWGWSGESDGYYLLELLNPQTQGTGGKLDGYNERQSMIIDIHPADEDEDFEYQPVIFHYKGDFVYNDGKFSGSNTSAGFYNRSPQTATFDFGILIVDSNGKEYYELKDPKEYACGKGTSGMTFSYLATKYENGVFKIYPIYSVDGGITFNYMYHDLGTNDYLIFTIENGQIIDVTPGYNSSDNEDTGVAMVKESGMRIVSSPNQNGFTIENVTDPTYVNVYGIAGESVVKNVSITTDTTLSLDNASSGIYIVTATNRNGTATLKIIKN